MVDEQATPAAAAGGGVRPRRRGANPDGVAGRKKEESRRPAMDQRKTFLDTLAVTCSVMRAAEAAGASMDCFYGLRRRDDGFKGEWREALEAGYDAVEGSLLRYVLSGGTERPEWVEEDAVEGNGGDGQGGDGQGGDRGNANDDEASAGDAAASLTKSFRRGVGAVAQGVPAWVHVAMAVLNRHRASVEGTGRPARPRSASVEQVNAALKKRLDQLAGSIKAVP